MHSEGQRMGIQNVILANTGSSTTLLLCKHHQEKVLKNYFWINSISDHERSCFYLLCYNPTDATSIYKHPKAVLIWQVDAAFLPVAFGSHSLKCLHLTQLTSAERIQSFMTALLPLCKGRGTTVCKKQVGKVTREGSNPLVLRRKISLSNAGWSWRLRVA